MAIESTLSNTAIGDPIPIDVILPGVDGQLVNLDTLRNGRPLVVVFSANHCPYVQHIESKLGEIALANPLVEFAAISSNDVDTYPDDDVAGMKDQLARAGWNFPYLFDTEQNVAKDFGAVCTPDFFIYDQTGHLAYRGAFDTSSPKNGNPLDGSLLQAALTHIVAGEAVPLPHRPAMGCGIKWMPGNDPEGNNTSD